MALPHGPGDPNPTGRNVHRADTHVPAHDTARDTTVPPQGAAMLAQILLERRNIRASMALAAKLFAILARSVVSVSNKLSIAAVLGLATLPILPHDAASGVGARESP